MAGTSLRGSIFIGRLTGALSTPARSLSLPSSLATSTDSYFLDWASRLCRARGYIWTMREEIA